MSTEEKTKVVRTIISRAEDYRLGNWVKDHWPERMTDDEVARMAQATLGFPVTRHHISAWREVHSIPSFREAKQAEAGAAAKGSGGKMLHEMALEIKELKEEVKLLNARLSVYFQGNGGI